MARGDGIHRTNARNMRLTAARIGNAQQHNEREKGILCQSGYCPGKNAAQYSFQETDRWICGDV